MRGLKRTRVFTGILTILLLGGGLVLHAQLTEGTLVGTVTDPTGAAVPGARVIITSGETGQVTEVETNEIGFYRAPLLRPGRYEIRIEASGFKATVASDVEVTVNATTRADVELQLGTLAETITVTEATRLVQTEEARLKDTFTTREVEELPLNGREVFQLVTLQPGVTATNAPVISNVVSPTNPVTFDFGFSANGASPRGNNFVLDGTTNNNEWLGGTPLIFPSVDAIEEFQVQTLNFSAEYGRNNGAVANIVTKSGSNDLHGTAFYFHRNTAVNARNFFDTVEKTPLLHNQFGFALGGPIVKNKTFFFANYEGSRRKDGAPELATAETPEFRDLVIATRPTTFAADFFRDFPAPPCVGDLEDEGSPLPLGSGPLGVFGITGPIDGIPDYCTVFASQVQDHRADQYLGRVDHNFTDSNQLFVRWIASHGAADVSRQELVNANMRGFRSPIDTFAADLSIGYNYLFSPTLINNFRFAFSRNDSLISYELPPSPSRDELLAAGSADSFPEFFGNLSMDDGVIPIGGSIFVPRDFIFNTWTIADTLTQVAGRHALKYGFEIRYIQENSNYPLVTRPFYRFNSVFDFANDEPWLLNALANRESCPGAPPDCGNFQDTPRNFRWTHWSAFFQDDWKVLPNLTLNLGLRYEVFGRPTEEQGRLSNITLGSGSTFFEQLANATVGRVESLFEVDRNNFAPRLGLAWDPFGKGTTVIRSGLSVAYLEPYSNLYTNASRFDPPETSSLVVFPVFGVGTDINYRFPFEPSPDFSNAPTANGGVAGLTVEENGTFRDLRSAYSAQWFLGVQHEFLRDYALSINYVGTRGVKLYIREDYNREAGDLLDFAENRLAPGWDKIFYISNDNDSIYHGMNAQVRKNYSHGVMFVANYTFGKVLDIVTDGGLQDYFNVAGYGVGGDYSGVVDINNRNLDRGPSEFDVRHRFTFSSLWNLPTPTSDSAAIRKLLGGWQVNSIISLQSGRPFSVVCGLAWFDGCDFNLDGLENDRPNAPSGIRMGGFSNSELASGIFGPTQLDAARAWCPEASLIVGTNPLTLEEFLIGYSPFFLGTACVPAGQNGSLGRNTFRGPAFHSVDVAVFKNTDITEQVKVQFRAEFFNLFNRANLFNPVGNMGSPNFGRSLSAFAPRQIQFGLKFIF